MVYGCHSNCDTSGQRTRTNCPGFGRKIEGAILMTISTTSTESSVAVAAAAAVAVAAPVAAAFEAASTTVGAVRQEEKSPDETKGFETCG